MERILVTGAASWTGGRLVESLETRPGVEVLAVDEDSPRIEFRSDFVRVGLDHLDFPGLLLDFRPHAVLHLETLDPSLFGGDEDANIVVGAQALFGAVARCRETRSVVVKSDSAVYGAGPRSPSVFAEDTNSVGRPGRHQRHLQDLEQFVADMAAQQPDVSYAVLRFAPIIGPTIDNPLSRLLRLPVIPTVAGFDPRFQFVYEEDAVGAMLNAHDRAVSGTFNIAAPGQIYLSRVLRLGRRVQQPLPGRAYRAALRALAARGVRVGEDLRNLMTWGRVVDTSRMADLLEFAPALNCRQAVLASYGRIPGEAAAATAGVGDG